MRASVSLCPIHPQKPSFSAFPTRPYFDTFALAATWVGSLDYLYAQ